MALPEMLAGNLDDFLSNYYLKLPYARQGVTRDLSELGTWQVLERALSSPDVDLLVVRQGCPSASSVVPDLAAARQLFHDGYTLVVRHAECTNAGLAKLAAAFAGELAGEVEIHLYLTPATQFGFSWHYDAEDVFILQTHGVKQYELRKNTVHPWPLVETLPVDMHYEREQMPLLRSTLAAGDWLYIPAGYWHRAQAIEDSISLAVGVCSTAAVEILDFVRARLVQSLLWRRRLPPLGSLTGGLGSLTAGDASDDWTAKLCEELAADFARQVVNPQIMREFIRQKQAKHAVAPENRIPT